MSTLLFSVLAAEGRETTGARSRICEICGLIFLKAVSAMLRREEAPWSCRVPAAQQSSSF